MGASQFQEVATGRDAREAFSKAVSEALYMNGHGGYTGSIAEKDSFVTITVPPRTDLNQFIRATWDVTYAHDRKGTEKALRKVRPALRPAVASAAEHAVDKWGPAVCVEVTGSKAVQIKARCGLKGTRQKVFVFFGLASS